MRVSSISTVCCAANDYLRSGRALRGFSYVPEQYNGLLCPAAAPRPVWGAYLLHGARQSFWDVNLTLIFMEMKMFIILGRSFRSCYRKGAFGTFFGLRGAVRAAPLLVHVRGSYIVHSWG